MANTDKNQPNASGPKKTLNNPRMEQIQRRATAMANRKPVSPGTFIKEAVYELKPPRTLWPTKSILAKSTTVVLALIVAVGVWVGVLDFVLSKIMNPLFGAGR